jgi:hypothetical protein
MFDRWKARLEALGIEVQEADGYVLGLLASREARLEELVLDLRRERDPSRRLRVVACERLAAADMGKALEYAEKVFGASLSEPGETQVHGEQELTGTGTDGARVLAFEPAPTRALGVVAGRIVAALSKAARPLTRAALRRCVAGSEDDFGRALREVIAAGVVKRQGSGKKARPFTYSRGGA